PQRHDLPTLSTACPGGPINAKTSLCVVAVTAALLTAPVAAAAVPMMTPLQSVLRDSAGALVGEGAFAVEFGLYDAPEALNPIWTESWPLGGATELADTVGKTRLNIFAADVYGAGESCTSADEVEDILPGAYVDNDHVYLVSEDPVFELNPQGGARCPDEPDLIYLYGQAVHHDGCTTAEGCLPNLAYPCEAIGDIGARFDIDTRRP
ncbi:MAG: hypothetical protein QF464_16365, partial [Myxococcota bacterium]|nr:hypothetical protein [Myxococcota bacterium]